MVKVNRINTSQVEGGYSDDSDKRPNGEMALYDDDNGGFDLVIHDGVNSTYLNKVLGKGKFYGHNADSADGNGYDTIKLIPDIEAYNNGSNQYLIIDPTGPNHIHIRAGGTQDNSNSQLFLGGENSFVSVYAGENPPIYIRANNYNWTFNTDGSFMLPTSGNITFGDETVQNTAASGLISEAFNTSLVAGSGISLNYDSGADTLTISSSGAGGGGDTGDITFSGSTISTANEDQSMTITTNGSGDIYIGADRNMIFDMNAFSGKGILLQDSQEDGYDDSGTPSTLKVGSIYHLQGSMVISSDGAIIDASGIQVDSSGNPTSDKVYGGLWLTNGQDTGFLVPGPTGSLGEGYLGSDVEIHNNTKVWEFTTSGEINLPESGTITLYNGSTLAQGTYDNSTGGNGGISLNCGVGYELNWQGGHLKNSADGGLTASNILCDSAIELPGSGVDNMEINSSGLIFPDGSIQTTAANGTTINNYADNRILTSDGTSSGINGESNLSFDGSLLSVTGSGNFTSSLYVNDVSVSVSGHTHTASDIGDFNSSVSGLLPVKDIIAGSYINVASSSGIYTVSGTGEASLIQTTVFNKTGSPVPKFSVVYINGGQGDQPTIGLAVASGEMTSSKTYGITAESIGNMSTGKVTVIGALTGLNTDQFNPTAPTGDVNGVTLWLSPTTPGGVTTTKPSAPNHAVAVGTIVRTHQNQGVVEVRIQNGYELEELHNVAISGVTNGQFLQYNSSTSLWIASSSGNFTILNVDNLRLDGNTISSTNNGGSIIIQPSGDGAIQRTDSGNARGDYAVDLQGVLGFDDRVASGIYSVVGGGGWNSAGDTSVVAGGFNNQAVGVSCFIGGGQVNVASGEYSCVLGGSNNVGSGDYSAILGGYGNDDGGYDHVFILGSGITASQSNTTYVENIIGTGYAKFDQLHPTVVSNGTVSGNVATNASNGQIFDMTVSGSTTLSNPTNAVDGVTIRWRITQDGTGGHTVALGSEFQIPSSATSPLPWSTAAGATDILAATYHAGRSKWDVVAFVPGY